MSPEEKMQQDLSNKFKYLEGAVKVTRARRVFLEVAYSHFREVFECAVKELSFPHFLMITGLDDGENLSLIYHLAHESGLVLNIKTSVPRTSPVVATVTDLFVNAEAYEREVVDLFGFTVEGLGKANRYPLPDTWPAGQYPLRKDWKPESLDAATAKKSGCA
ncbi:MAG: NADH-quinone oxidoreductase subunit C [Candidatus Omnitrophota bacterium]